MRVIIGLSAAESGAEAATLAGGAIRAAIAEHGAATIVLATGVSQYPVLAALIDAPGIDWARVTAFHLDEYVGLPETHGASFRRFLRSRFLERLPVPPAFMPIAGDAPDAAAEVARLCGALGGRRVDVCLAGIGENGHLAFNDPPADFETDAPYLLVSLDEACRRQQLGEGWFDTLDAVPRRAISMSIRQMLRSRTLIVTASQTRKARAVADAVDGPVSPDHPASILQTHEGTVLLLDPDAASLLRGRAA